MKSEGRHRGREVALQVLYAIDLSRRGAEGAEIDGADPSPVDRAFDRVLEHFDVPHASAGFARDLVRAVVVRLPEIDELLGTQSRNWRVARMPVVDRNVLRLAVYELCYSDTPIAVVIDEAVDLARRFGGDASPAFVNGVLDAVARLVRAA